MNLVFGTKLKELRSEHAITQAKMAEIIGVSKTTICQWETHKQEPSLNDVTKIAIHFAVSSDYLLGLEDEAGNRPHIKP